MDPRDQIDRPVGTLITATILLVTASWMSFRMPLAMASFEDPFRALGADLPAPTRVVLAMPHVWLIFVVLALPLCIWVMARARITRQELGRMKLAIRVLIILMLLAYGFAAWAIYIPIFKMGQAI